MSNIDTQNNEYNDESLVTHVHEEDFFKIN